MSGPQVAHRVVERRRGVARWSNLARSVQRRRQSGRVRFAGRSAVALVRSGARRSPARTPTAPVRQARAESRKSSTRREAYIPTEPASPRQDARLPRPHAHQGRTSGHQGPPAQGPDPADGLIWTIRDRRAFQRLARSGRRIRTRTLWCTYLSDPSAVPLRVALRRRPRGRAGDGAQPDQTAAACDRRHGRARPRRVTRLAAHRRHHRPLPNIRSLS